MRRSYDLIFWIRVGNIHLDLWKPAEFLRAFPRWEFIEVFGFLGFSGSIHGSRWVRMARGQSRIDDDDKVSDGGDNWHVNDGHDEPDKAFVGVSRAWPFFLPSNYVAVVNT